MAHSQSKVVKTPRLYYLDNFRTYLTILVIYHHASIPYGGIGSWSYISRFHTPNTSPALIAFNTLNQSYFMSSFLFLSGYLTPPSLKRKRRAQFLATKYWKLGVPMLVYTLLAGPLQIALIRLYNRQPVSFLSLVTEYWRSLNGIKGAVWYNALLLIFDTVYSFLPTIPNILPTSLLPNITLDIVATFITRLFHPALTKFAPLNLQLGYTPGYIASYALGTHLARTSSRPDPPLSKLERNVLLAGSVGSTAMIVGLLRSQNYASDPVGSLAGGANMLALSYAIWGETAGYLLGTSILSFFQRNGWLNRKWREVGRYSYAAFLVHPLVCVAAQVGCDEWDASGVVKMLVTGTVAVGGSWGVGWGLAKIPGVRGLLL